MQPHQQRVVDEQVQLQDKIDKLSAFIGGTIYNGLPPEDQTLLREQLDPMKEYNHILEQRIARFKD